jgi:hypothetical protein
LVSDSLLAFISLMWFPTRFLERRREQFGHT